MSMYRGCCDEYCSCCCDGFNLSIHATSNPSTSSEGGSTGCHHLEQVRGKIESSLGCMCNSAFVEAYTTRAGFEANHARSFRNGLWAPCHCSHGQRTHRDHRTSCSPQSRFLGLLTREGDFKLVVRALPILQSSNPHLCLLASDFVFNAS